MVLKRKSSGSLVPVPTMPGQPGPKGDQGAAGTASTVAGPKGDPGPQGIPGPTGQTGAAGSTGGAGPQGVQGPTGTNASDTTLDVYSILAKERSSLRALATGEVRAKNDFNKQTDWVEDWNDLTSGGYVTTTGYTVSGNRLVGSTSAVGIAKYIGLTDQRDEGWFETELYWNSGASGYSLAGILYNVASGAAYAADQFWGVGINSNGAWGVYEGGTGTGTTNGFSDTNDDGSKYMSAGTPVTGQYHCYVYAGPEFVSSFMIKADDPTIWCHARYRRRAINTFTPIRNPSHFCVYAADNRTPATSRTSFGPVRGAYKQSAARPKVKTLLSGGSTFPDCTYPFTLITGYDNLSGNVANEQVQSIYDTWRVQVPADYDQNLGAPLVVVFHDQKENRDTFFTDNTQRPLGQALANYAQSGSHYDQLPTGAIIATAKDQSTENLDGTTDRWGSMESLANYRRLTRWVHRRYNVTNTIYMGIGMGALSVLNGLGRSELPPPDGLVLIKPYFDLARIVNDGGAAPYLAYQVAHKVDSTTLQAAANPGDTSITTVPGTSRSGANVSVGGLGQVGATTTAGPVVYTAGAVLRLDSGVSGADEYVLVTGNSTTTANNAGTVTSVTTPVSALQYAHAANAYVGNDSTASLGFNPALFEVWQLKGTPTLIRTDTSDPLKPNHANALQGKFAAYDAITVQNDPAFFGEAIVTWIAGIIGVTPTVVA